MPKNKSKNKSSPKYSGQSSGQSVELKAESFQDYQNRALRFENIEMVKRDFFTGIENHDIPQIIDFLKAMRICNGENFSTDNLNKILRRINDCFAVSSLGEAALILECFHALGYKKHQLETLNISNFSNIFNQKESLSSKEIGRFLKDVANLSYDKDEVKIDVRKLVERMNLQSGNVSLSEKITFMNSLAKLGYDSNHGEILPVLQKMSQHIFKEIHGCEADQAASFLHSLVKMELFDQLFEKREGLLVPKDVVRGLLNSDNIAHLSSNSAFSLMQSQMNCELFCKAKLFREEEMAAISEKYIPDNSTISSYQNIIAKELVSKGFTVEMEYSVYDINGKDVRDVDIKASKTTPQGTLEYYFEVEGPTHLLSDGTYDSATRKRDRVNELAIANNNKTGIGQCYYVKTSVKEINSNRDNLGAFLDRKMSEGVAKEIQIDQENLIESFFEISVSTHQEMPKEAQEEIRDDNKEQSGDKKKSKKKSKKKKPKNSADSGKESVNISAKSDYFNVIEISIRSGEDVNNILIDGLDAFSFIMMSAYDNEFGEYLYNPDMMRNLNSLVVAGFSLDNFTNDARMQRVFEQSCTSEYESLFCALPKCNSVTLSPDFINKAVEMGSVKCVESVVSKEGFNPSRIESERAIKLAAHNVVQETGEIEILNILIKSGIDPSKVFPNQKRASTSQAGNSFTKDLLTKSLTACPELFLEFVKHPDSFANLTSKDHQDLLFLAATSGNEDAVREMLSSDFIGFDSRAQEIALIHAAQKGHQNVVKYLMDKGVSIVGISDAQLTPFVLAAQNGHLGVVNVILEEHPEVIDQQDEMGKCTALIRSARKGQSEVVNLLLRKGANPNIQSDNGNTALMLAVNNGYLDIVDNLLGNNADIYLKNSQEVTAVEIADHLADNSDRSLIKLELDKVCGRSPANMSCSTLASQTHSLEL